MSTTTVDNAPAHDAGDHGHHENYLVAKKGLMSWVWTVDHKRLGLMYLAAVILFFLVGGLAAIAVRTELLNPGKDFMDSNAYNRMFTLHGAIMVFLVIIPSIPASLGNLVLPLMLGAKDVAFPKLNLASFWVYVLGAAFFLYTMVAGGVDTGWTFYTPYSIKTGSSAVTALTGAFVLGFSSIFTGINFLVTIHKMRAPGLSWDRLPLFVWALYATALMQVLATPVLAITLGLLVLERTIHIGIFDPAYGGDPVLFQHFFWFYSHPAVYIMIVPGFGMISELITVHSRKGIFGYKPIAISSVAIAFIGFLVWGHHLFVSSQSALAGAIFSFLTFVVAVPTAIKVFSWIATLYKGSIQYNTPMVYALSFLFLFSIGGLTGLFLGVLSTDVHLTDTYFVIAHFHYVMMGGTIIAFIGGVHHWWHKFSGKHYNETVGVIAAIIVFIGFNVTFFTQFIFGAQGMPRRYWSYLEQYHTGHTISTIGSYILAVGLFLAFFNLLASLRQKGTLPEKWRGVSLEWETATPPIEHNFESIPVVTRGPYDFPEIQASGAGKGH